jgi:hypothetical protein
MHSRLRPGLPSLSVVILVGIAAIGPSRGRAAEVTLTEALPQVEGWVDEWSACFAQYALAAQLGVPDEQFRACYPGVRWQNVPPRVIEALRAGSAAIPEWLACLDDPRASKVVEYDPEHFTPERNRRVTCGNLALNVVALLVPGEAFDDARFIENKDFENLRTAALKWHESVRSAVAPKRLEAWHLQASTRQRLALLAQTIRWRHTIAYPVIEADFLRRAPQPNDSFYREVAAFLRHRRRKGVAFLEQLDGVLPPGRDEVYDTFYRSSWRLLASYDTMAAVIDDWSAGRVGDDVWGALVASSVNQPWAKHGNSVEPSSVHRAVAEANLRDLVAAAARETRLERRIKLTAAASYTANVVRDETHRSDRWERGPLPRVDAPEWRDTLATLRNLLEDDRLVANVDAPSSPAGDAAEIVIRLWGDRTYANVFWRREEIDWRVEALQKELHGYRRLRVEGARAVLSLPNSFKPEIFPKERAAQLSGLFRDGNAVRWRAQAAALGWEEQLMLQLYASQNRDFAARATPRLLELVEARRSEGGRLPETLETLWRDKLAQLPLDAKTWNVLCEWLVEEVLAGRYWALYLESSISRPGIDLILISGREKLGVEHGTPILAARIAGSAFPVGREWFEVRRSGLQRVDDNGKPAGNQESEVLRILTGRFDETYKRIGGEFVIFLGTMPSK